MVSIGRTTHQAYFFTEDLGNGIGLEMALIPGGEFTMGSPDTEEDRRENEHQHQVRVPTFFMGCHPVTQAQWRVVAAFPQVKRKLESNPSYFQGDTRPVERVSWYEAVEFCDRLARYTARDYRLPREGEWEYACRAGTNTPFHFGETLSTDLANYDGNYIYGRGEKGEYRQETTSVGEFPPNAFGLYDMHGNVWEWCGENWHENYGKTLKNKTILPFKYKKDFEKLLRGCSWYYSPGYCRSAIRYGYDADYSLDNLGFRVACPRTF